MEKLKSFEELFQNRLGGREGVIKSGEPFLGVFVLDSLKGLEDLLRVNLGVYVGRKKRPFVAKYEEGFYLLVFLTTKTYSKRRVDLRFCNNNHRDGCRNLELTCFLLKDINRNEVLAYAVHEKRFESFSHTMCGVCRDFDFINSLKREYFR